MIQHGSSRLGRVLLVFPYWWFSEPILGISGVKFWGVYFRDSCWVSRMRTSCLFAWWYWSNKPSETTSIWVLSVVSMGRCSWGLTSDSSWLSGSWGPSFLPKVAHKVPQLSPKSHFDPWNKLGDQLLGVLSFSRGLCSSRLSMPKPVWPVSQTGLTGLALWAVVKSFWARESLLCYGFFCSKEGRLLRCFRSQGVFGEFLDKTGLTGLPNRSNRFPLPVWGEVQQKWSDRFQKPASPV
jgi:hypothetical protein